MTVILRPIVYHIPVCPFEPDWPQRPWPPRDKWGAGATDAELGLV